MNEGWETAILVMVSSNQTSGYSAWCMSGRSLRRSRYIAPILSPVSTVRSTRAFCMGVRMDSMTLISWSVMIASSRYRLYRIVSGRNMPLAL